MTLQDLKQQLPEKVPIWAVDTACVVPMRLLGKSYEKAWAYRSATQKLSRERIDQMPYRNSQTDFKTLGIPEEKVMAHLPACLHMRLILCPWLPVCGEVGSCYRQWSRCAQVHALHGIKSAANYELQCC